MAGALLAEDRAAEAQQMARQAPGGQGKGEETRVFSEVSGSRQELLMLFECTVVGPGLLLVNQFRSHPER